jgi:hypothetical protein
MPAIHKITDKHHMAVRHVRQEINGERIDEANPVEDKDAAWAAYERMKRGD